MTNRNTSVLFVELPKSTFFAKLANFCLQTSLRKMPRIFFRQRLLLQPVNPFSDFEAKLVDLLDLKSCNSIKRSFFFSQRLPTKGTKEDSLAKILSKMDPCSAFSGRNEKETKTREKVFWLKTFRFTFALVSPKRCWSDYLLLWREKESSASITKTHCPRWPIGWRWTTHPLFSSIYFSQTVRFSHLGQRPLCH